MAAAALFPALTIASSREIEARGKTHAVVGLLQRVDGERVTLQTKKGVEIVTLVADSQVRQGATIIESSRLGSYVGQKIKVRYVENGGRKEVQTVTIPSTAKASSP